MALGGGRHNEFTSNLIIQSQPTQAISMDARGGGGSKCCAPGKLPYSFLFRVPFNTSTAWKKYSDLPNILDDEPCTPKHNRISDNVLCGGVNNLSLDAAMVATWGSVMANNTVATACPKTWPL